MIGFTEESKNELVEWLESEIADIELVQDEIPFGLDVDSSNQLVAYRFALKCLKEINHGPWIEWHGGDSAPVNAHVEIKLRDGTTDTTFSEEWVWRHSGESDDIIAYREVTE